MGLCGFHHLVERWSVRSRRTDESSEGKDILLKRYESQGVYVKYIKSKSNRGEEIRGTLLARSVDH